MPLSFPLRVKPTPYFKVFCIGFLVLITGPWAFAHDSELIEKLSVFGKKESLPSRPGSAHVLSQKDLEIFDFNDIHQVLRSVPGVNLQEEDGFGLRPNIGLRGGHPHRSKKVAIMEDGVLIGPAPYSAPAAYYFPQLSKIESIEVFKGAPATAFGPNSIGGAINLVTRTNDPGLKVGVQQGLYNSSQYNVSLGIETYGDLSVDFNRTATDGFKELENQEDTGFVRNNVTLKWDKSFNTKEQSLNLKYNWSDEVSNETYTGLTDSDFEANPLQRYTATENDLMDWTHRQYFASYAISPTENLRSRATLYSHQFERSWDKMIGFAGTDPSNNPAPQFADILNNPDFAANNYFYQVLKGDADSGVLSDGRDVLELGDNQRQYLSQGLQLQMDYELDGFSWDHNFQLGFRYHEDDVRRFHESRFFNMTSGRLVRNESRGQTLTLLNQGQTQAQTVTASYETQSEALTMRGVLRYEDIHYDFENRAALTQFESQDHLLAPGFGVFHQSFENTGFIAGVNKAFTPTGPRQSINDDSIRPEEAINYELGVRHTGPVGAELIGFYSDYSNLLGFCTQSAGCTVNELDQRFNGGEAEVFGAEMMVHWDMKHKAMTFPIRWAATYTQAEFRNSFSSDLRDWGLGSVESGDPIPYIPDWQSNLLIGWQYKKWGTFINANYLGEMADQAVSEGRRILPSRVVYGMAATYQWKKRTRFKFRLDNITDERYAVSRRPFGLRPGLPFMAFVGVESAFF